MKKLKHSKYRNTGILFELLVRKLTSETMTSDKSLTIDIIKKYFGKNTELAKELQLYNNLIKEQYKSEAYALEFIRNVKDAHKKLNQSVLKRQRYNLVKEIQENFVFENIAKTHINNYKVLASVYMLFEHSESANPKQLMQCKSIIVENGMPSNKLFTKDVVLESYRKQPEDMRLLSYNLLVEKFNKKYGILSESQKDLLGQYITSVNDTDVFKTYIGKTIPKIKTQLKELASNVTDTTTKIKVEKLSEMLCSVENKKTIKESHVLSLLRYMDLVNELKQVNS
tara:strand:+ start:2748 stop:3596 length:849 start_codon:yes stop_codon:yes gene_type:complete